MIIVEALLDIVGDIVFGTAEKITRRRRAVRGRRAERRGPRGARCA